MRYKLAGTKWFYGQTVTSLVHKLTIVGKGKRDGMLTVRKDKSEYDIHEHCLMEHPINGGNYGESNDTESPA